MKTAQLSMFIVEDDPHFRETFVDVMVLRGVSVQSAGSGLESLRLLQEARPSVIVIDVQLPDIHGIDLCRRIKRLEAFKQTPVIFISASSKYTDSRDQVDMYLAGACAFLPKPLTMERLWSEIELHLKSR